MRIANALCRLVEVAERLQHPGGEVMTAWKRMMDAVKPLTRGRRRRPPGAVLVEKVGPRPGTSLREQYERANNPLQGIWGSDPDSWLDELRSHGWERSYMRNT